MKSDEQDAIVRECINTARKFGAKSPREAMEIIQGREITEQEWEEFRRPWESNWERKGWRGMIDWLKRSQ